MGCPLTFLVDLQRCASQVASNPRMLAIKDRTVCLEILHATVKYFSSISFCRFCKSSETLNSVPILRLRQKEGTFFPCSVPLWKKKYPKYAEAHEMEIRKASLPCLIAPFKVNMSDTKSTKLPIFFFNMLK